MKEKKQWSWDNRRRVWFYFDEDGKYHETKEDVYGFDTLKPVTFPVHEVFPIEEDKEEQ